MKQCFKCNEHKELTEFYRHSQMADGHLNKCKDCTKKDTKEHTEYLYETDSDFAVKEKVRGRKKYHKYKYDSNRGNKKETMKSYNQKYPEKYKAKCAIGKAVPTKEGFERHHWSYNEDHFLDVLTLPIQDHAKAHRYMTYDTKAKMYRSLEGTLLDTKVKHLFYLSSVLGLF